MTKRIDNANSSRGGVRRPRTPGESWSYVIDLGLQDAQRCNGCGKRQWVGARRLEACPACGGPLRATTERRTVEKSGFETDRDAQFARAEAVVALGRGDYRPPQRLTLAAYLRDVWLPEVRADGLKTTTQQSYERIVIDQFIGPSSKPHTLGTMQLSKVTLSAIRRHYEMLAEGYSADVTRKNKTVVVERKGLSTSSIRRAHAVLHRSLEVAVTKYRLLDRNPAHGAARKLPGREAESERLVHFWEPAELRRFLAFTRDHDSCAAFEPLWYLIAHTGVRRGEALGLKWEDLDGATLTVRRARVPLKGRQVEETSTKTKRQRTIDLDKGTVTVLKRQAKAQKVGRLKAGPSWDEGGYVFTDEHGAPLDPWAVSWQFRVAVQLANEDAENPATPKATKLTPLSVHGLRHTHASIALQAGIPVTVVAKRLGHASTTMTLNVYSHVLKGAQADLADTFASVVRKGAF